MMLKNDSSKLRKLVQSIEVTDFRGISEGSRSSREDENKLDALPLEIRLLQFIKAKFENEEKEIANELNGLEQEMGSIRAKLDELGKILGLIRSAEEQKYTKVLDILLEFLLQVLQQEEIKAWELRKSLQKIFQKIDRLNKRLDENTKLLDEIERFFVQHFSEEKLNELHKIKEAFQIDIKKFEEIREVLEKLNGAVKELEDKKIMDYIRKKCKHKWIPVDETTHRCTFCGKEEPHEFIQGSSRGKEKCRKCGYERTRPKPLG